MRASGGMTIRFSPPLYFTMTTCPSTLLTVSATVALVIVPRGARSHGRKPSPTPRNESANTATRTARCVPSGSGTAPTPMKAPAVIALSDPRETPKTRPLFVRCTALVPPPSIARIVTSSPSICSIVPVMRIVWGANGCAVADAAVSISANTRTRIPVRSHRRRNAAADIQRLRNHRAVGVLLRTHDDDLSTGLQFALVAFRRDRDHRLRIDVNSLLAVFIFNLQRPAVLLRAYALDVSIGHGAARPRIPRPVPVGDDAALRRLQDMDRERLDRAIGARHARDADEAV